ncbi:MAG: shikimate dehydrogenase [Hyphomicrobium sp.]
MRHAAVIGWPIEQSRSPLIHGYWLRTYGIDGTYTKIAVRPEDVREFLRTLDARGLAGCNVTVPHKEAALEAADEIDASALAIGAANTLWLDDGKLHAANTDSYGFMTHLARSVPDWQRREAPVSILGAGGAARAIVHGFLEAGVAEVRLFNRSRGRSEALAHHFGPRVRVMDWTERSEAARDSAVLVNTTTLGMKGSGSPDIDFRSFDRECIVADIVYVPLETEFLARARAAGLRTVDGLGMLLHQAVPGFERWFGRRPEVTDDLHRLIVNDIETR